MTFFLISMILSNNVLSYKFHVESYLFKKFKLNINEFAAQMFQDFTFTSSTNLLGIQMITE